MEDRCGAESDDDPSTQKQTVGETERAGPSIMMVAFQSETDSCITGTRAVGEQLYPADDGIASRDVIGDWVL